VVDGSTTKMQTRSEYLEYLKSIDPSFIIEDGGEEGVYSDSATRTFVRFFGIRRSGNHALQNWLIPKFNGSVFYKNNANVTKKVTHETCNDLNCFHPKHNYTNISKGHRDSSDLIFLGYEDKELTKTLALPPNEENIYGEFEKYLDIFVVRNPYNLFCSKAKHYDSGTAVRHDLCVHKRKHFNILTYLWKDMGERLVNPQPGEIGIYYDKWHVDQNYRKEICEKMGVPFNDKGKHLVSNNGGGSSFDGLKKHPDEMNLLNRTSGYEEYDFYLKLLEDKRLNEIFKNIKDKFKIL
tara:strand:- start:97 stop:978 length:882 start_codon:yes stop_codon:yes gene_type:complete